MARTYRNPFSERHLSLERAFADNDLEMGAAYDEVDRMEEKPVLVCGNCGGNAYFKATVGRHCCPDCGAVRVGEDVWSTPKYPRPSR